MQEYRWCFGWDGAGRGDRGEVGVVDVDDVELKKASLATGEIKEVLGISTDVPGEGERPGETARIDNVQGVRQDAEEVTSDGKSAGYELASHRDSEVRERRLGTPEAVFFRLAASGMLGERR